MSGELTARTGRFVVLTHTLPASDGPDTHWDLMLEQPTGLATWALEQPPDRTGGVAARQLPDHRLVYLTYEGPISGNRGEVSRWDAGHFALQEAGADTVRGELVGARLNGHFLLQCVSNGWRWEWLAKLARSDGPA